MADLLTATEKEPVVGKAALPVGRDAPWWLIARVENGRTEVLTVRKGGQSTLPVFSFEEEAELFLRLGRPGGGWSIRESRRGELISVLSGQCAGVERVALDPLPEPWTGAMIDLCCLGRGDFVAALARDPRSSRRPPAC
jgi:hypothetical protein